MLTRSTESHLWNLAVSASCCQVGMVGRERVSSWDLLSSQSRCGNSSIARLAHEEICGGVGLEIHFCTTWESDCGEQLALTTSGSFGSFFRLCVTHSPMPESPYKDDEFFIEFIILASNFFSPLRLAPERILEQLW